MAGIDDNNFEEFARSLLEKSKKASRKAVYITIIPIVMGLGWLIYSAYRAQVYTETTEKYHGDSLALHDSLKKLDTISQVLNDSIGKQKNNLDNLKSMNDTLLALAGVNKTTLVQAISQFTDAVVFIQVGSKEGSAKAKTLKGQVQSLGYTAPGIEVMRKPVPENAVYYYHPEDSVAAKAVAAESVKVYSFPFKVKLVENPSLKAPKGQVEVWVKE